MRLSLFVLFYFLITPIFVMADMTPKYEAILSCGINGQHIALQACFCNSPHTELELRKSDSYKMYQCHEIATSFEDVRLDGVHIDLGDNFELKAQNSSPSLLLTIKIINKNNQKSVYEKSASSFGHIWVSDKILKN